MSNRIPVLFMDDEIDTRDELKEAIDLLKEFCDVKACKTMSEAFKLYCNNYYRILILDIDMTGIEDPEVDERNGGILARAFRSLNSSTAIIMYTNATSDETDVFKLSRYCISGYIHKRKDGPEKLKDLVLKKAKEPITFLSFPKPKKSGKIAICLPELSDRNDNRFVDSLIECLNNIGENFSSELVDYNEIDRKVDDYAAILFATKSAFTEKMPDKIKFKKKLDTIINERKAHVVLLAKNITYDFLNHSVFRIVKNNSLTWQTDLLNAIQDALYWYGMDEVIDSENKYFKPIASKIDYDKYCAEGGDK